MWCLGEVASALVRYLCALPLRGTIIPRAASSRFATVRCLSVGLFFITALVRLSRALLLCGICCFENCVMQIASHEVHRAHLVLYNTMSVEIIASVRQNYRRLIACGVLLHVNSSTGFSSCQWTLTLTPSRPGQWIYCPCNRTSCHYQEHRSL